MGNALTELIESREDLGVAAAIAALSTLGVLRFDHSNQCYKVTAPGVISEEAFRNEVDRFLGRR